MDPRDAPLHAYRAEVDAHCDELQCQAHRSNVDRRKYCQFSSTDDGPVNHSERPRLSKARKPAYYGHTMRKQEVVWRKRWCSEQFQVHIGEEDHARPGWITSRRGQYSPWKSQSEWRRAEINGERTSMVWLTLGSRTAKEQNKLRQVRTIDVRGEIQSLEQSSRGKYLSF